MRTVYAKTTSGTTPPRRDPARRSLLAAAALAAGVLAAPMGAFADDAPTPVTGDAAWGRVVGNTVAGSTPDGPYSEFFVPDGTLRIVDADGKAGGRWTWHDGRLCTAVDDEEEECRTLAVTGTTGAFIDDAGSRYPFGILPGNPKGL